ncbi:MAG TPA: stage II sporulation protein M [Rubricoccaceae bacterium]|nr:stage II sporulation protein M [Rubricoccaceae bacterium]
MREAVFIRRYSKDWKAFEERLAAEKRVDPDALAGGYVRLTDDLAYAKTFYPGSATAAYLNGLAVHVHAQVYRNRREERGRLRRFWTEEIPRTVYQERRPLLWSLVFFLTFVAVGVVSTLGDDTFVRLILGDGYVNMTLANIEAGDPMAVYKEMRALDMFFGITLNNVMVSFYAFGLGILASVGTVWLLLRNGVMLGAFQTFFFQQAQERGMGLFWESVLTVWIHGTLEISAIVVAGGAGLAMGNALLFPGTYPRMVSFRRGAMRGLKIVIGLVPLFIVAGFLEGFVTRHTAMPTVLSVAIILGSLAFVLGYFVVLPWRVHRRDAAEAAALAEAEAARRAAVSWAPRRADA